MKLTGQNAIKYCLSPNPVPALLLHGEPSLKIKDKYKHIKSKLVGNNANDEMRLTEITAAELRKNKSLATDAIKAIGFFPGPRLVLIENCTDGLASLIEEIIFHYEQGDAFLIVTAGFLPSRSKLRKLFENNSNAISIGVYQEPPTMQEISSLIETAGITGVEIKRDLAQLGLTIELNEFKQLLEKITLYKMNDSSPISYEDVLECTNISMETELEEIIDTICSGNTNYLGSLLKKLTATGQNPTSICIGVVRHFRNLHILASQPSKMEVSLLKIRPPIFGARRNKLISNSKKWGIKRLERAIQILMETDLRLRSSKLDPKSALMERALIKISMMVSK